MALDAENRNYFTATDKGGLAQGAQAAGILVEHRKAHGIQVLQDADGTFARHTQGLAQYARGGSAPGSLDSSSDKLARMRALVADVEAAIIEDRQLDLYKVERKGIELSSMLHP